MGLLLRLLQNKSALMLLLVVVVVVVLLLLVRCSFVCCRGLGVAFVPTAPVVVVLPPQIFINAGTPAKSREVGQEH